MWAQVASVCKSTQVPNLYAVQHSDIELNLEIAKAEGLALPASSYPYSCSCSCRRRSPAAKGVTSGIEDNVSSLWVASNLRSSPPLIIWHSDNYTAVEPVVRHPYSTNFAPICIIYFRSVL
jgi:hypothetical protein